MAESTKDWVNPKIEIRKTSGKGKGMFAIETISAEEPLVIFGGEYKGHFTPLINDKQADQ